jgi:hypothetical protein
MTDVLLFSLNAFPLGRHASPTSHRHDYLNGMNAVSVITPERTLSMADVAHKR